MSGREEQDPQPALDDVRLVHDREANRFRLPLSDGRDAFIEYQETEDGTLDLLHTYVPRAAREQGVGTTLVELTLGYVAEHGWRIKPSCPFVAAYLREHPEHAGLVR
jgi:uncharacterized protein